LRKYANGNKGGRPKKAKENLTETKIEPKHNLNESKVNEGLKKGSISSLIGADTEECCTDNEERD
jgi:hypothetical protein